MEALEKLRENSEEASEAGPHAASEAGPHAAPGAGPRDDVPPLPLFYTAYKIAKKGQSFQSYEADVETMRAGGCPLKKSRGSRFVCKNMIECEAEELSWEDSMLLSKASDVALTMDGRKGMLVVRVRLTMGYGMPKGFRAEALGGESPAIAAGASGLRRAGNAVRAADTSGLPGSSAKRHRRGVAVAEIAAAVAAAAAVVKRILLQEAEVAAGTAAVAAGAAVDPRTVLAGAVA